MVMCAVPNIVYWLSMPAVSIIPQSFRGVKREEGLEFEELVLHKDGMIHLSCGIWLKHFV